MHNLDFLKTVIMSEDEYWVVAKKNESTTGRLKDSIILTCIPYTINRGVKEEEILLSDIEKLRRSDLMNIHINERYAPFQTGITFYNIYRGFPIKSDVKSFLIKAIEMGSDDIFDYKELAEKLPETDLAVK